MRLLTYLLLISGIITSLQNVVAYQQVDQNNISQQSTEVKSSARKIPYTAPGRTIKEFRNQNGFAVVLDDESILTWSSVSNKFDFSGRKLESIISSTSCFSAFFNDGSGITWAVPRPGTANAKINFKALQLPASSNPKDPFKVASLASNEQGFAAVLTNNEYPGRLVTWSGGFSKTFEVKLPEERFATSILASSGTAFVARLDDGSLFLFGVGNRLKSVLLATDSVRSIVGNYSAFTILFSDGSITTWAEGSGSYINLGAPQGIPAKGTTQLFANYRTGFAALLRDKTVFSWSYLDQQGGGIIDIPQKVNTIIPGGSSFTALLEDGGMKSWNMDSYYQDRGVPALPKNVKVVSLSITPYFDSGDSFTALLTNRDLLAWNIGLQGEVQQYNLPPLSAPVFSLTANQICFAAILEDGNLFSWAPERGDGEPKVITPMLPFKRRIDSIAASDTAFAARLDNGDIICWGDPRNNIIIPDLLGRKVIWLSFEEN